MSGIALELTRFSGRIMLCVQGVDDVRSTTAIPGVNPAADGGARPQNSRVSSASPRYPSSTGRGQAAIDSGKPLTCEEGLTTAQREELVSLRRQRWNETYWQRLLRGLRIAAMRIQRSLRTRDCKPGPD